MDHDLFDRSVADVIASEGATHVPPGAVDELLDSTSRVRPLPRWLALIKEPPMRRSAVITVGSPTARLATIVLSTVLLLALLAGTMAGAMRVLGSASIIVSADGDGHYETISAAVAAATDGDVIEIRRGHYPEEVRVVGKDLQIRGAEGVVVEAALIDAPIGDDSNGGMAFYLEDTTTSISDLVITGSDGSVAIAAIGAAAAPLVERVTVTADGTFAEAGLELYWDDGASGLVRDSDIRGWVSMGTATTPELRDNRLEACISIDGTGARPVFADNVVWGCPYGFLISLGDGFAESSLPASAVISGNDFQLDDAERGGFSSGNFAVLVMRSDLPTEITGNTFRDSMQGIGVRSLGSAHVEDNDFRGNQTAVWVEGDEVSVIDNRITDNSLYGLLVHGSPTVESNTIESNLIGINLGASARPALADNSLCDNETDLKAPEGNPTTLDGNNVC